MSRSGFVAVTAALCWVLLPAAPAAAHAELLGTTPASGAVLARAPAEVVLRFSEPVAPVRDATRLLDATGSAVRGGAAAEPVPGQPERVRLAVPSGLPDGLYVVAWRVVSADSHPVAGSLTFTVGEAVGAAPASTPVQAVDSGVRVAFWTFRGFGYAALALLLGGAAFLVLCWPAGWSDRRARRLVWAGWWASLGAAAAVLVLQGPYAAGKSLAGVLDPALLRATVDSDYGRLCLARLALLAAGGFLLARLSTRGGRMLVAGAAGIGLALPLTWAAAGHARVGAGAMLALAADAVHVLAMAVWLGGLALLFARVLPARGGVPVRTALAVLPRFSWIASAAVAALVVTGAFQAWRELRGADLSGPSGYPRLLAWKLAAFGLLICLGAGSRALVRYRYVRPVGYAAAGTVAAPAKRATAAVTGARLERVERKRRAAERRQDEEAVALLRRSVRLEVVIAAAVLALTAALVSTSPAGHAHREPAASGPYSAVVPLPGGGDVQVWLAPARSGPNELVLNVRSADGLPRDVPEVAARLVNDAFGAPMPVPLERAAPGRYTARAVTIPSAGAWGLRVTVRTSEVDQYTVTADIPVA
ncbi:copper resistance protein CopC [Phytohabitans aurantiacus]|uniref:Transport integral membrane protein n=1 Tax=Phytohabitans aurantiacus TaxID=3016789 RepID=A0ABQ5QRK5_9ACTN|nr:copper resistance protein CopC [Phytohabitans aurantiacus]GLH96344.1 transport integral membrane protein [Phytohabitans aurantiacus]